MSAAKPEAVAKYAELKAACAADAAKCVAFDKHAQGVANWWGVKNISAALFGLPDGFITIFIISLVKPAPSKAIQALVDATRLPAGGTLMEDKGAMAGGH